MDLSAILLRPSGLKYARFHRIRPHARLQRLLRNISSGKRVMAALRIMFFLIDIRVRIFGDMADGIPFW
jgi:hypothetical protein